MQMRCIIVFIKYFIYMIVSIYASSHDIWILDTGYITFYHGKHNMAEVKNGRSKLIPITYRILTYNAGAAL